MARNKGRKLVLGSGVPGGLACLRAGLLNLQRPGMSGSNEIEGGRGTFKPARNDPEQAQCRKQNE
jgi:hypothetical protein